MPRANIDWHRNDWLKIVKMLAWVIKEEESVGVFGLWNRMVRLLPSVVRAVTGEAGVTLVAVRDHTLKDRGLEITPDKVFQRADKAERYAEFSELKDRVMRAYYLEAEG